jgi:hypothetical protein
VLAVCGRAKEHCPIFPGDEFCAGSSAKVFPKVFLRDFISSSGLWKCGKAERSWRGFSKPLWESAFCADFHRWRHFHQAAPFLLSSFVAPSIPSCENFSR